MPKHSSLIPKYQKEYADIKTVKWITEVLSENVPTLDELKSEHGDDKAQKCWKLAGKGRSVGLAVKHARGELDRVESILTLLQEPGRADIQVKGDQPEAIQELLKLDDKGTPLAP